MTKLRAELDSLRARAEAAEAELSRAHAALCEGIDAVYYVRTHEEREEWAKLAEPLCGWKPRQAWKTEKL